MSGGVCPWISPAWAVMTTQIANEQKAKFHAVMFLREYASIRRAMFFMIQAF
jgi:hypothetical protein